MTLYPGLDQVAITAVYGQDVSVGRDLEAEGIVQSAAFRDGHSRSARGFAFERMVDGDDAVVKAVGDIKHLVAVVAIRPAMSAESKSGRSDHDRVRIGTFRKA